MSGKRVVVTGGDGFLGSFVVERLRRTPWCGEVFIPHSRQYDLRENEAVLRMYKDARPDIVIHMAGRSGGIGANQDRPAEFFYDNLLMGVQVMHQAHLSGVEKFVAIGNVCAYPKLTSVPFHEDAFWDGYPEEINAPYALAKKMLLVQAQAYRQQYRFNAIYLLPVNLYGPWIHREQAVSYVIPALIKRCLDAVETGRDEITIWGDGIPTREFLYVEDCAEAIVSATEHYSKPAPVNIGSGVEVSIKELVEKITRLTGFQGRTIWDTGKPGGQPRRCLDTSRAYQEFGWRATTQLDEGLRRTIDWYRTHR